VAVCACRSGAIGPAHVEVGAAVLTVGGEIEEERQRSFNESSSAYGISNGRSGSSRLNRAAFVHASADGELVSVGAGARIEDNEMFGTGVTWQSGLSAHLPGRPQTRLRASVGTAIKEPTFYESFATGFVIGNPTLDPERSLAWEVGAEHVVWERVALQATYFDQRFEDLIQYTYAPPNVGDPNYYNVAGATSHGVEVDAAVRWTGAEAGVTYTWLRTEVTNPGFDSGEGAELVDGDRLLRRPAHSMAVRGARSLGERARMHTSLSAVGSRDDRSFDPVTFSATRVTLPRYLLWTLGLEWDAVSLARRWPDVTVSLRAENLLDESYQEAWGFDARGRQLFLGLRVGLGGGA